MKRKELLINHFQKLGYKLITVIVTILLTELKKYDKDLVLFFNPTRRRYEIDYCLLFNFSSAVQPMYAVILV